MDLISLLIVLIIVGVVLYLIFNLIPMEPTIRGLIVIVVVLFVCLWLLQAFGIGHIYIGGHRP